MPASADEPAARLGGHDADDLACALARAADWLVQADSLVITAGAGLGVDSGLPDFRGTQGFWRAYPALGRARIAFEEIADPAAFAADPRLAWGFYGHRLALYRATRPHAGFALLRRLADALPHDAFVFTSNVDGQFQQAGFPAAAVCEIHGSLHHLQCSVPCHDGIWRADDFRPEVDADTCRLLSPLPECPRCGALARPNVLMFGDGRWVPRRTRGQQQALEQWLRQVAAPVVLELGAGTHVPTVRWFGESLGAPLLRINPDADTTPLPVRGSTVAAGALAALHGLGEILERRGFFAN